MCAFVDKNRDEHGVEPICKALQIAPSTYYARRSRPESARAVSDRELGEEIESVPAQNYGVYGVRKIHKKLHRQDIPAARCTVERLMRQKGLRDLAVQGVAHEAGTGDWQARGPGGHARRRRGTRLRSGHPADRCRCLRKSCLKRDGLAVL